MSYVEFEISKKKMKSLTSVITAIIYQETTVMMMVTNCGTFTFK